MLLFTNEMFGGFCALYLYAVANVARQNYTFVIGLVCNTFSKLGGRTATVLVCTVH